MDKLQVALPKNPRKFHTKQTYDHMPGGKGGIMRGVMVGPGSSGKTVTLQWLLLGPWRGLADKIAIWSPTIFLQPDWEPVIKYMKEELDQGGDNFWAFENFDQSQMDNIVEMWTDQTRKTLSKRSEQSQEVKTLLMVFDDVADNAQIVRSALLPHFVKLRHAKIHTVLLQQQFHLAHPVLRVNCTFLLIFRLRDEKELDNVITSLSGHYGYKKTMAMYRMAVDDAAYSFMYVDLLSNPPKFYIRFEKEMT